MEILLRGVCSLACPMAAQEILHVSQSQEVYPQPRGGNGTSRNSSQVRDSSSSADPRGYRAVSAASFQPLTATCTHFCGLYYGVY